MSINLNKGGRINLAKEAPGLNKIAIGLGWDLGHLSGTQFDLDTSVFMINERGKLPADEFFIFYNNLKSPDGGVQHCGDNRTGTGDGDDETILVNLLAIHPDVSEIIIVATIHDAELRRQNFGLVRNAYLRIYDQESNREIAKYDLDEDFSHATMVEIGRLYKKDQQWRFLASGLGSKGGLQELVDRFA